MGARVGRMCLRLGVGAPCARALCCSIMRGGGGIWAPTDTVNVTVELCAHARGSIGNQQRAAVSADSPPTPLLQHAMPHTAERAR